MAMFYTLLSLVSIYGISRVGFTESDKVVEMSMSSLYSELVPTNGGQIAQSYHSRNHH